MTSVSNQHHAPQYGYEMPPTSAPVRSGNTTETAAPSGLQPDSTPLRSPVTPEQRGQFSSHNHLVNPPQSHEADANREMMTLVSRNNELLADFKAFVADCQVKIGALRNAIKELNAQVSAENNTAETSVTPDSAPQDLAVVQDVAPPQTSPEQGTQATGLVQQSLEDVLEQNAELRKDITGVVQEIIRAFAELRKELEYVIQQFKAQNKPEPQATGQQVDTTATPSSDSMQTAKDQQSPTTNEPSASSALTADRFRQENAEFESLMAREKAYYEEEISSLERTVEELKSQIKRQQK